MSEEIKQEQEPQTKKVKIEKKIHPEAVKLRQLQAAYEAEKTPENLKAKMAQMDIVRKMGLL